MSRKVTSIVTATVAMVVIAVLLALPAFGAAPNPIVRIRANGSNSAVVRAGGDLWVWGYNYVGQVGDGTKENNRHTPFNDLSDSLHVERRVPVVLFRPVPHLAEREQQAHAVQRAGNRKGR